MTDQFDIYEEYGKERIRGDRLFDIAADLLKACEFALAIAEDRAPGTWDDVMIELRRAIAKAKADAAQG